MKPNLRYYVKQDGQVVAAFATRKDAIDWAEANISSEGGQVIDCQEIMDEIVKQSDLMREFKRRFHD